MENIKTDEQLKKEMIKKVDIKKCRKLYAMSMRLQDNEVNGFDKIIQDWADKKVRLYKLLGEKLKIENNLNISREELNKIAKKDDGVFNKSNLSDNWYEFLTKTSKEVPIFAYTMNDIFIYSKLLEDFPNVSRPAMQIFLDQVGMSNLKENETMPLSKIVHKLFNNEKIDIELSKFIQSNGTDIIGNIYISIDPFDYLTMSVNKSNWTSCHSLHKNTDDDYLCYGEYSAGIFSYLCDEVSMIAYRTDGQQVKFGWGGRSFMAESKNWRQMIFVQKDFEFFINSRQYPFKSEFLCKIVREMIEQLIDKKAETNETTTNQSSNSRTWKVSRQYGRNKQKINDVCVEDVVFDDEDDPYYDDYEENIPLHYNDPLNDWEYTFTYRKKFEDLKEIWIGSQPLCPICGNGELHVTGEPFCHECYNKKIRYK